MAFYELEPFGERLADFRAGQICATVANYAGKARKEGIGPANPADFMPSLPKPKVEPILLADPVAHSHLIMKAVFKREM